MSDPYHRTTEMSQENLDSAIRTAVEYQEGEFRFMLDAIENCAHDPHITRHAGDVALFMKLAGQEIPKEICIPDEKTRILRAKLIMEEALETIEALGISIESTSCDYLSMNEMIFSCTHDPDLEEIVDGCLDIRVVTTGTLIACGVPDIEDLQEVVDVNNITKFRKDKDGYKREDGKWVKPSDHPAPKVGEILKLFGWNGISS